MSPTATSPNSLSSNLSVIILFTVSTDSITPPPGALQSSPTVIFTRLYLYSGASRKLLNFKDSNSPFPFASIKAPDPETPGAKFTPVWTPFCTVYFPEATSSIFLFKNSLETLNALKAFVSKANVTSPVLISSNVDPPPVPDNKSRINKVLLSRGVPSNIQILAALVQELTNSFCDHFLFSAISYFLFRRFLRYYLITVNLQVELFSIRPLPPFVWI